MVYAEQADFKLLKGEHGLGCYQFNTKVAEHYFCRTCGIYTHHKPRALSGKYGINAGCLQGIDPFNLRYDCRFPGARPATHTGRSVCIFTSLSSKSKASVSRQS